MARGHIITGLDIGTQYTKILVARKKPKEPELDVLAQFKEKTSGVRRGVVIDIESVSEIIQSLIEKVREESKKRINSVYVNIGGGHVFRNYSQGLVSVSRADQKISQEDIDRVLEASQAISLPSNKEILEIVPKEFIIDGQGGIREPLGLEGIRLEVNALILGGFSPYIKKLTKAVLSSNLRIDDLILSPLASARSVLTPREKELGVAILDIGAGTTDLAVFEEGILTHLTILPIGSGHITNDIAIGLKCDVDTAEQIKLEYGSCVYHASKRMKDKIKLESLTFSRKMLVRIIEARIREIFRETNKELKKISRKALLPGGIVLTGGGSKAPKILELAKRDLKLPCRLGLAREFSLSIEDPSLSTVCGLVLLGTDFETEGLSVFDRGGFVSKLKKIFKIFIP